MPSTAFYKSWQIDLCDTSPKMHLSTKRSRTKKERKKEKQTTVFLFLLLNRGSMSGINKAVVNKSSVCEALADIIETDHSPGSL